MSRHSRKSTLCTPRAGRIGSASRRAVRSVPPPAGKATIIRIGWVVLTITMGWPIVAYLLAAWLADAKPRSLSYYDDARAELDSARRDAVRPARAWHFSDVKNRFDRVEDRLRTLEQVVTSREFQMDRELRGTGRV